MILLPLTNQEFDVWAKRCKEDYVQDKMRAHSYSRSEAETIAEDDFSSMLSMGLETPNNFVLKLVEAGLEVGYLWFCIRDTKAFLCDFIIEEEFRRRGLGQAAMKAFEAIVQRLGLEKIGLHVFGFNSQAIELYKSLGFVITDLTMEKRTRPLQTQTLHSELS